MSLEWKTTGVIRSDQLSVLLPAVGKIVRLETVSVPGHAPSKYLSSSVGRLDGICLLLSTWSLHERSARVQIKR